MATNILTNNDIEKITSILSNKNEKTSIIVEFNNGDLNALKEVKDKWKFKDLESALRFGLAILTITDKGKLLYETENDKIEKLNPTNDLIETKPTN